MRYAADLHLHSRYASAVSPQMTVETIARWARRKGVDVLATGDCLQPEWRAELEGQLVPAEPGWFQLRPNLEERLLSALPASLRRPLRFVLSTEVSCASVHGGRLHGVHLLLYFPSFGSVRRFRERLGTCGDFREGRPEIALSPRRLLEAACSQGDDCHLAPAHVLNPYFSSLGTREAHPTLHDLFGDLTPRLLAVETGLTANPAMCRRISALDAHALFSCSDAHSPDNIGRECTLLDTKPGYGPMFAALRTGARPAVAGTLKFPILRTRYFLNRCARCKASFEGAACPRCGGPLVQGSRDRLERIADRAAPAYPPDSPPFHPLLPLKSVLAELSGAGAGTAPVERLFEELLTRLGPERHILARATREEIAAEFPLAIAEAILANRTDREHRPRAATAPESGRADQLPLFAD